MKLPIINPHTGLIEAGTFIPSPNHDDRAPGMDITLLVIHNISLPPGAFGGDHVFKLFLNQLDTESHPTYTELADITVSAHCFIRRDGSIIQFVPFHKRAWHAGKSCYQTQEDCNHFSIGIELEGTDDLPYEKVQYEQLIQLTYALLKAYPTLSSHHIVGHSDIAPGRKTDPGPAFDWVYFKQKLAEVMT